MATDNDDRRDPDGSERVITRPGQEGEEGDAGEALRAAQTAIERERSYSRALFRENPLALAIVSRDGLIVEFNATFAAVFGLGPRQRPPLPLASFAVDYSALQLLVERARTSGSSASDSLQLRRLDRTPIRGEVTVTSLRSQQDGDLERDSLVAVNDLGPRDRAAARARRAESRFVRLLEGIPDPIVVDEDERITFANEAAAKLLGLETPKAMLGADIFEFIPDSAVDEIAALRNRLARGESLERQVFDLSTPDGQTRTVEVSSYPLLDDDQQVVIHVGRDLTELLATLDRMQLFESIVVEAHDMVVVVRPQGRGGDAGGRGKIVYANAAFGRLAGYPTEQVVGRAVGEFLASDDDEVAGTLSRALAAAEPFSGELLLRRRDGPPIHVDASVSEISARPGRPAYAVAILRDISERKRAELLEEDRARILSILSGGGSREPLYDAMSSLLVRQFADAMVVVSTVSPQRLEVVTTCDDHSDLRGAAFELNRPAEELLPFAQTESALAPAFREFVAAPPSATDPVSTELVRRGARSIWYVPICPDGEALEAVAYVGHASARTWTKLDETLLRNVAGLTSAAVQRAQMIEKLEYQATRDPQTGLWNRYALQEELVRRVDEAGSLGKRVGLIFVDIDDFKTFNESRGHAVGDEILSEIAARIGSLDNERVFVARQSGDEFGVIVSPIDDVPEVEEIARAFEVLLEAPIVLGDDRYRCSVTMGISIYPDHGQDARELARFADAALHRAKEVLRGSYVVYDEELGERAERRLQLEGALRAGISRGELVPFFQPKVDLFTGAVIGAEALVRWFRPGVGMVSPAEFIPLAEETGLIREIGAQVLRDSCEHARWVRAELDDGFRIGVNVSAVQFADPRFTTDVLDVLGSCGLPAHAIDLEVTESVVMHDIDFVATRLRELRSAGLTVSIDDFGTGYSSLLYLRQLPVDTLKIDRTFISALGGADEKSRRRDEAVIESLVTMARGLGLDVVAEGVETAEQAERLRQLGCTVAQGYLFARPIPGNELVDLIRRVRSGQLSLLPTAPADT